MFKAERYAQGKWDVHLFDESGEYPVRVGHIIGGNRKYLAEKGPRNLGYFQTKGQALQAIAECEKQAS